MKALPCEFKLIVVSKSPKLKRMRIRNASQLTSNFVVLLRMGECTRADLPEYQNHGQLKREPQVALAHFVPTHARTDRDPLDIYGSAQWLADP